MASQELISVNVVDMIKHSIPSSRKALRSTRKIKAKALKPSTVHKIGQIKDAESEVSEESVAYECCICRDDFPLAEGVVPCEAHFTCNECVVAAFDAALNSMELFPARCCTPLPRRLVEHLLSPEVIGAYKAKAKEYYTSCVLRVYCINDDCRRFIPGDRFDDNHAWYTVARCVCGTNTCVGCKQAWLGEQHLCIESNKSGTKPEWLPEYSSSCRIKQCPTCRVWIEHREACNHMTCCYCRHEFCFICLQPWSEEGFHEDKGCPPYGDPAAGYDDDGFEQNPRGLHRDTGYNREGLDRFGQNNLGQMIRYAEDSPMVENAHFNQEENGDLVDYDDRDEEAIELAIQRHWENWFERQNWDEEENGDEQGNWDEWENAAVENPGTEFTWDYTTVEAQEDDLEDPEQETTEQPENLDLRLARRVPIFASNPDPSPPPLPH